VVSFKPRPLYYLERTPVRIELQASCERAGVDILEKRRISCPCRHWHPGWFSPWPRHYTGHYITARLL